MAQTDYRKVLDKLEAAKNKAMEMSDLPTVGEVCEAIRKVEDVVGKLDAYHTRAVASTAADSVEDVGRDVVKGEPQQDKISGQ